ncbi:secreted RxLR effector protein 161-like [Malus domestica]|uniref:secreted RxLR effector protein 161-like n=1 Tax=Malus domestica TaxID=3750 RepID=UPI00397535BD
MVVRTLDAKRDPFRPKEDEDEILEPEVPYLSAIRALLYLAQCTRPDISFTVNLLARYSNVPTHAGYLSDLHRARSQTGYIFTVRDTIISWRSTKQTLVATSSNHAEILALHEVSRECFWLREVMEHIRSTSGLTSVVDLPTTIFEDNAACIEQLKKGYIKGDNTKHITSKFFYSHQQQQYQNIEVK